MSLDDSLRRIANQAFFDRLIVTDERGIDADAGTPFDTLFNPAVQATALARAGGNGIHAGKTGKVVGLNDDLLVGPAGFEPTTPAV